MKFISRLVRKIVFLKQERTKGTLYLLKQMTLIFKGEHS